MNEILDGVKLCIPSEHAESHELGGSDELDLTGLSGGAGLFTEDGDLNIIGGTGAGVNLTPASGLANFLAGVNAGNELASGDDNIAIGNDAMLFGDGSNNNIVIGRSAGRGVTGQDIDANVIIGFQAGYFAAGAANNVFIGYRAGLSSTDSAGNVFVGTGAGNYNQSGDNNVCIGRLAGEGTSGNDYDDNVLIGNSTGLDLTTGSQCVLIGSGAGVNITSGGNNVFVGHGAGSAMITGTDNVFIGFNAGAQETGSDKLYIANTNTTTPLIIGDFSAVTIGFLGKAAAAQVAFQAISAGYVQAEVVAIRDALIAFGFMAAS